MSLGWKFYVKYAISLIPLSVIYLFTIFLPKDKALKFTLENRVTQSIINWIFKT